MTQVSTRWISWPRKGFHKILVNFQVFHNPYRPWKENWRIGELLSVNKQILEVASEEKSSPPELDKNLNITTLNKLTLFYSEWWNL